MSKAERATGVVPEVTSLIGQTGIHIRDPIEDVQAVLYTDSSVEPREASTEDFVYPVDRAVEISVESLTTPYLTDVWIRKPDGTGIDQCGGVGATTHMPSGEYLLEVTGMVLKIYIRVDDVPVSVSSDHETTKLDFNSESQIRIGMRSPHSQPARTITTTGNPNDLMKAISVFGTAMKTWSPERTYPSLRGHPPLLELGDSLDLPESVQAPETDISLSVPPSLEWVFPVAPLAYWLGAAIEEGEPALHLEDEQVPLGIEGGYQGQTEREAFENHLQDILQYTFLFDCAVRTEGFYQVELDTRSRLDEAGLSLDYQRLYGESLVERVRTYMDLEPTLEGLEAKIGRPGWRLTADVQPSPERATVLPFLARDLAVVRCHEESAVQSMVVGEDDQETFFNPSQDVRMGGGGGVATRSSVRTSVANSTTSSRTLELPSARSMSQAWVGDGFAIEAAKASTQSYLQRLENKADGRSRINIDVVVNDAEMSDERTVSDIYGTRDLLEFDVDVHDQLSVDELATVFEKDSDFIHYIGHVDGNGFECQDDYLSADQLTQFGADSFVLNACESHAQGEHLVDNGAIGGVVTLEEVISVMATEVGETIARLVNLGFPLGAATSLVQKTMLSGSNYVAVGDTNASLVQSKTTVPYVTSVGLRNDDRFDVSIESFASWSYDIGTHFQPFLDACDRYYVVPGELDTWTVSESELDTFLNKTPFPVVASRNLFWSDQVTATSLRKHL